MRSWTFREWVVVIGTTIGVALVVAVPTAVLPNPWFDREVPVTWWSYPTLAATAVLSGLLAATFVRSGAGDPSASRRGWVGGALSWFAVGCPVCNKIVLLALGYTGALTWFAPIQPLLAVGSIALLAWALRARLRGRNRCCGPAGSRSRGPAMRPAGGTRRFPRDSPGRGAQAEGG